jgi:hypothetical protein
MDPLSCDSSCCNWNEYHSHQSATEQPQHQCALELGYLNAIQSIQQKKHTNTIPELMKAVEDSCVELDRHTLNKITPTMP